MYKWQVETNNASDGPIYQCWRQTRELRENEPMHTGVRTYKGEVFKTREEAQTFADNLNAEI